jgi:hypothetical protein
VLEPPYEDCDPPAAGPVCSEAQFAQNPQACGCDASCKRIVCGNGRLQPGEECDPPNDFRCDAACQLVNASPCEECLNGNAELAEANLLYCNSAACAAVKECVVESRCMVPPASPANCFCGSNTDDCDKPDFDPSGPCEQVIVAGVPGTPTNALVYESLGYVENASGAAVQILALAYQMGACQSECFTASP